MLIFGIDTCCMAATAALVDEKVLLAQTVINHKKTHSQMMMPQIEEMFRLSGIDPKTVDAFAAAVGPGSFTGVRIGVATAKAMAQAQEKPCIAVSTLEALAFPLKFFDGIVAPILDARRNQVYNALFKCECGKMTRLTPDRAVSLESLLEELNEINRNVLFVGDGTLVFEEEIKSALKNRAHFAPKLLRMNLAGAVAEIGFEKYQNGEACTYSELVPQYVRLSQAEQDLLKKEQNPNGLA